MKASDNNLPSLLVTEQASAPTAPASGQQRIYMKTDHKLYHENSAGLETEVGSGGGGGSSAPKNVIINGAFYLWQRQDPSTLTLHADDVYGPDRWYHLSEQSVGFQSNRITGVSQRYSANLKNNYGSSQRIGLAQIIEGINAYPFRGQQVTFHTKVKCSDNITIRCRVLEWTGTEDVVTSDIVNTWAGDISSWVASITATGSSGSVVTPSSSTWYDLTQTITLGSSFTNLIAFIWTDGQLSTNGTLVLESSQLELGGTASAFEYVDFTTMITRCQRYYEKSFEIDISPAKGVTGGLYLACVSGGLGNSYASSVFYKVSKRAVAVPITFNSTDGAAADGTWTWFVGGAGTVAATSSEISGTNHFVVQKAGTNTYTLAIGHYTVDAEL